MPGWGGVGRIREGTVREFGMDMYTPVYLKWITKKDLLYSMYMELCLMSCGSLDGTGAWGEKGYMCMHG